MSEVYEGSPIGVLTAGGGLRPGQVGVVVARAGVGKSALIAHVALHELLRERKVLHVAVRDSVDSARAHYDAVIRAVTRTQQTRDWSPALVAAERHRMIHSYLDKEFKLPAVEQSLGLLSEVMQFKPELVVIDGIEEHVETLAELGALARRLGVPLWVAFRTSGAELPSAAWQHVSLELRLTPDGRAVRLAMHRGPNDVQPLEVVLDPTTMLVRGEKADGVAATTVKAVDCTLYSGGARGSEASFGLAAEKHGVHEVNFTFEGHKQDRETGRYLLSPRELAAGDVSLVYVSRRLNRSYSSEGGVIRKVLQTIWHMVSRSQQVFVVGEIQDDGTVVGGTGWSVELARMWNKDLWVFDQTKEQWFAWQGEAWVPGTPTIRSLHFSGTGTRYLKDSGQQAIDELFARSFGG